MTVAAGPMDRTLLPYRHLRWRSTTVALIAIAGPVCGVTTWLALQGGDLVPALVLTALVLAAAAAMTALVARSRIVLTSEGLRCWTPRRSGAAVSRSAVARAVVRAVHQPDGRGIRRHLFLLGHDDRTVFRMCDRWWTETQVRDVARHFEVPVESPAEPVHLIELRRTVSHQLQWNEQHPVLARLAMVGGGATACLLVGWLAGASL
ncbi:hypothetical protein [Amnibacterium endophyticum]|uniref:PH domain-containing protein n=1 Tax=Amnibacterium endophyticum TaxID=2109337 RepID=A0ABW4LGC3_9MICO